MTEPLRSPWDQARHQDIWRHKIALAIRMFVPGLIGGAWIGLGHLFFRDWNSPDALKADLAIFVITLIPAFAFSYYFWKAIRDAGRAGLPLNRWFWEQDLRLHLRGPGVKKSASTDSPTDTELEAKEPPFGPRRTLFQAIGGVSLLVAGTMMVALLPGRGLSFPTGERGIIFMPISGLMIAVGLRMIIAALEFGDLRDRANTTLRS